MRLLLFVYVGRQSTVRHKAVYIPLNEGLLDCLRHIKIVSDECKDVLHFQDLEHWYLGAFSNRKNTGKRFEINTIVYMFKQPDIFPKQ